LDTPGAFVERRRFKRRRMLKAGRIVFNNAMSTFNCMMRNHSEAGARLEMNSTLGVPDAFDLRLEGLPSQLCALAWRKSDALGVAFITVEEPAQLNENLADSSRNGWRARALSR
jgi:hypothetical protein